MSDVMPALHWLKTGVKKNTPQRQRLWGVG